LDAHEFVLGALRYTFSQINYPIPSDADIKKTMGRTLAEFYRIHSPGIDPSSLAKSHKEFQEKNFHLLKLFPKAEETLIKVKEEGFSIAAVSNRSRDSLLHSLKLVQIFDYFDAVVSVDDVVNPKPHKEHVLTALKHLKVKPDFAYMVGDTQHDVAVGKSAKVKTVGVTYGFLGKDIAAHNPDFLINDISQLLKILK